ncbi:MAG: hypothetical protein OZSIB_2238 [Candidatus Ozemobacter sibiricus]|uniref:Uncharacterized protein n=1 Tax=Candidatus Ozemobacter sibiricus TaxID=2268124 RepID=A0A367ZUH6_9BACT|nr:MAG: hypothetical protein OZSIB_2238 [Candidatus Ozemobacter sibiricus]
MGLAAPEQPDQPDESRPSPEGISRENPHGSEQADQQRKPSPERRWRRANRAGGGPRQGLVHRQRTCPGVEFPGPTG